MTLKPERVLLITYVLYIYMPLSLSLSRWDVNMCRPFEKGMVEIRISSGNQFHQETIFGENYIHAIWTTVGEKT